MCAHTKHTKQRRWPLLRPVILTSDPLFSPCAQLRGWHWGFELHTHTLSEGENCSEGDCTNFSLLTSSSRRAPLTNSDNLMNCFLGDCSAGTAPNWRSDTELHSCVWVLWNTHRSCAQVRLLVLCVGRFWQLTQVNQCTSSFGHLNVHCGVSDLLNLPLCHCRTREPQIDSCNCHCILLLFPCFNGEDGF